VSKTKTPAPAGLVRPQGKSLGSRILEHWQLYVLLLIPINKIIEALTELSGVAVLPPQGGIILVIISMFMTFLAGLIPARIAANKDPVIALRTE
jgi:ABC-type lipoprotein release transport system permease subunit